MPIQNRYQNAKIYQIRSHSSELVYIGATCEPTLARRFACHKSAYKRFLLDKSKYTTTSHVILDFGDAYIELIEKFPCDNRDELCKREGHYIRINNCVNKRIEGRTPQEYKDNKEHLKNYGRQYRADNKEHIDNYRRQYIVDNKEHINNYRRQHYKKKMACAFCNSNITKRNRALHIKTDNHIKNYKQEYFNCWGVEFTGVLDGQDY
tara:strand:+ start:84 stop:704 length:621 start_codon:yes stop_codon:yes gene_type:complete